uniref:arginyltransferase n=1 Tax=Acrobeloides nanus TaxID=290746 RepID=A0A914DM16_9BILA
MPLIERFRSASACIQIDAKPEFELFDSFSSSLKTNSLLKFYQDQEKENQCPEIEYFGKVPLKRNCAHGREMEQLKLHTDTISVEDMNDLIDLGWRREGNNFYKVATQCCTTHALRLDVQEFKLSRQQRKILNHLAEYFRGETEQKNVKKPKNNKNSQEEYSLEAYFKRIFDSCNEHTLEIRLVRPGSSLFFDTYEESFQLFKKYQEHIHKNAYTREIFENMLVETPLPTTGKHYGTFHRQILIDGRLVGVDMFDILPDYNMAQTSYYNTDFMHLNLGTFMILNEILFTQKLSEKLGKTLYLSTGLYNHCFKKHHYKLQYATEILCIETCTWIPLDKNIVQKLEEEKQIMCQDSSSLKKPGIFSLSCLYKGKVYKFSRIYEKLVVRSHRRRLCSLIE